MMRSMFAAISGLKTHQVMLDVTANDISNVNTIGYKGSRMSFKDALAQQQRSSSAPTQTLGGTNPIQLGLGVQINSVDTLMTPGGIQSTGNPLDLAVQGDGFFRIAQYDTATNTFGQVQYTRAGNFTRNSDGFLVTQDGYYVMGSAAAGAGGNAPINIPNGATNLSIGQDGAVSYDPAGGGARVTAGYITLAKFPNEGGLERTSSNRWRASAASGAETPGTPGGNFGLTTSGTVEMSNVDLASEFTNMISAQRGFQANSRVISTSDELLQDLVNLKR